MVEYSLGMRLGLHISGHEGTKVAATHSSYIDTVAFGCQLNHCNSRENYREYR